MSTKRYDFVNHDDFTEVEDGRWVEFTDHAAEIAGLQEALRAALESDGGTGYADSDDEVGYRICCGVVSYKPHRGGCWVIAARKALAQ